MKRFVVAPAVFERLPDYCLGAVAAEGFDNGAEYPDIARMLDEAAADFAARHAGAELRELPGIRACREAFQSLGMNPNRFPVSVEALARRVQKSGSLPHINPLVDLGNAVSLRHVLPVGAHDVDRLEGDLTVRFSTPEDSFLPMGETQAEPMPEGELCYVSGHTVKTRRWLWRQSEDGKITPETRRVFFPIDGFARVNAAAVLSALEELARYLSVTRGLELKLGFIDRDTPQMILTD